MRRPAAPLLLALLHLAPLFAAARLSLEPGAGQNLWDPHTPGAAPWFEAWYTRASSSGGPGGAASAGLSATVGIATVRPPPGAPPGRNVGVCVVILQAADARQPPLLRVLDLPPLSVARRAATMAAAAAAGAAGGPPPAFSAAGAGAGATGCSLEVDGEQFVFKADAGDIKLRIESDGGAAPGAPAIVPWSEPGSSPEGWAAPIIDALWGMHWHVWSKATPARITLAAAPPPFGLPPASLPAAVPAFAHSEKYWGKHFPYAHFWSQAVSPDGKSSFVFAGGPVPQTGAPVVALLSLHTPRGHYTVDPQDLGFAVKLSADGCAGVLEARLEGPGRAIEVRVAAPPGTYVPFPTPTAAGIKNVTIESHVANATIRVYGPPPLGGGAPPVDAEDFEMGVLEFGGLFACGGDPTALLAPAYRPRPAAAAAAAAVAAGAPARAFGPRLHGHR